MILRRNTNFTQLLVACFCTSGFQSWSCFGLYLIRVMFLNTNNIWLKFYNKKIKKVLWRNYDFTVRPFYYLNISNQIIEVLVSCISIGICRVIYLYFLPFFFVEFCNTLVGHGKYLFTMAKIQRIDQDCHANLFCFLGKQSMTWGKKKLPHD